MMVKPKVIFWSISEDFIYRYHVNPRVKLYVPTEESLPIPLKDIDVTSTTDATLEVMSETTYIDDYWNVDGNRVVGCMDRFHEIHCIE